MGLWVPSILAFGIYLRLINNSKNDWIHAIFRRNYNLAIWVRLWPFGYRWLEFQR
jgi:hypothetical protein